MTEWEDYYKILQVHYLAEQEVIESAYKKLAKKYHPDLNSCSNAEEIMKSINCAFEVLSNPISRKQYFLKWVERQNRLSNFSQEKSESKNVNIPFDPSNGILLNYFELLSDGQFELAYNLLSETDIKNITKSDFIMWQTKVSDVFDLKSVECAIKNIYTNVFEQDTFYDVIVVFDVKVKEMNKVMDWMEDDEFTKSIVLENNRWRVFLGYKNLDIIINKFDSLARLKNAESDKTQNQNITANIDRMSGLFNMKGFTEKAEKEQQRHNRYGNVFSVILCEIDDYDNWKQIRYSVIKQIGELIKTYLRDLDISCRWKGKKFIILLPETNSDSARIVAEKLKQKISEIFENNGNETISMSFVAIQQKGDLLSDVIKQADKIIIQLKAIGKKGIIVL